MDKWREDVYTWCKVHVVEGMDTCPWVYQLLPDINTRVVN
jgi:hypothetical protein